MGLWRRFDYTNRMLADPLPPTLARQVALVTGGARRVGKAIAIELARRGARVAIHANSSMDEANRLGALLLDRYGTDVGVFQAELTDDGAAEDLVHRVAATTRCPYDRGGQGRPPGAARRARPLVRSGAS